MRVQLVLIFVLVSEHCHDFISCRIQTELQQPCGKALLPEVLLKLLSHPLGVQRALGCYHALVAVSPVPQRAAFSSSITSGQAVVKSWHVFFFFSNLNFHSNFLFMFYLFLYFLISTLIWILFFFFFLCFSFSLHFPTFIPFLQKDHSRSKCSLIMALNSSVTSRNNVTVGHCDFLVFHDMLVAMAVMPVLEQATLTSSASSGWTLVITSKACRCSVLQSLLMSHSMAVGH